MALKDFLFQNLYYFVSAIALLSGFLTYLYFYNREVLSLSSSSSPEAISSENVLELNGEPLDSLETENPSHLIVDLSGAVARPGIYSMDSGDRLADLISLSGGVTSEVSQKWLSRNLNLSSILKDQQKIYIPFEWEIPPEPPEYEIQELQVEDPLEKVKEALKASSSKEVETSSNSSSISKDLESSSSSLSGPGVSGTPSSGLAVEDVTSLINVNQASKEKLIELPGVGEVTAGKIIDNRPYSVLSDLHEKAGVYESTLEKIKDLISF